MHKAHEARILAESQLGKGNVAEATRSARQYLQLMHMTAPVVCYPLLDPQDITQEPTVRELAKFEDSEIASTAQLMTGMPQFLQWAEPFLPPAMRLLVLERCIAVSPNLLLTSTGQLLNDNIGYNNAELCVHMPQGFPGIAASHQRILLAVRHIETAQINKAAIYLSAASNYAAWLFGSLPRLAAYAALNDLPIIFHGDAPGYQLASLAAMGISEERLIRHQAHVRLECRELFYCTTPYFHHAPSPTGLGFVRDRINSTQSASPQEGGRRLYLARREARDRPLLNEAQVIQLFERYGFVAIDPEMHSFDQQIRFATAAEIVAGPYGANLANLIFARRARKFLILATKGMPEFARLASLLGVPFWHTVPDAVKLREGRTLSESYGFTVNLEQTEAVLQACLSDE